MSERNGASNGFWWLLIGYLLGVATTIGAILFLNRNEAPRRPAPDIRPAASAAPAVAARPVKLPSAAPTAAQERAAPDEQVAEDAAATGMTSRSKRPDTAQ